MLLTRSTRSWQMAAIAFVVATAFSYLLASSARAELTSFAGTNLVLMRGGDATSPQSTFNLGEVPAYLDAYSVSVSGGVASVSYVDQYTIPSATLTLPGIDQNSHEGRLNLAGNGQYLNFGGYNQAVSSSTTRAVDGSGGVGYLQVGQVSSAGAFVHAGLSTGSDINTDPNPQFIRAAYSNDGTQAWVASKSPNGGLQYVAGLDGGSPTTTQLQTTTDWRDVKVNGGQLYGGTGSSSVGVHGFYSIGTGSPTTGTPANTLLSDSGNNSISAFAFAMLPGGTAPINGVMGANVVYGVGDPSGNNFLGKLYNDGAHGAPLAPNNLVFAGGSRLPLTGANAISSPEGVLALVDPDDSTWIDLFVQNADGVYFAVDKSGTSSGSIASLSFTKIIGSGTNVPLATGGALYGISTAPISVPEPASLAILGLAAAWTLTFARRRRC
jgi:PEP-CTERM motif